MTAATAYMDVRPRLALVPPGRPAEPGVYQKVVTKAGNFWSWLSEAPGRFWGWLKKTFHLQPLVDKVKAAATWTVNGIRAFCQAMGFSGLSGLGLLTVTTGFGRWMIKTFVVTPVNWLLGRAADGWRGVSNFFANNLGSFGNWMANRMGDVEDFFWGTTTNEGLFPRITRFYREHIAAHIELNSVAMRVLRLVGTCLFGIQLIAALPLLGLTGTPLVYANYAGWGTLYLTTGWQSFFLGERIGQVPAVNDWINKNAADPGKHSATSAKASTGGKLSLAEAAKIGGNTSPGNR